MALIMEPTGSQDPKIEQSPSPITEMSQARQEMAQAKKEGRLDKWIKSYEKLLVQERILIEKANPNKTSENYKKAMRDHYGRVVNAYIREGEGNPQNPQDRRGTELGIIPSLKAMIATTTSDAEKLKKLSADLELARKEYAVYRGSFLEADANIQEIAYQNSKEKFESSNPKPLPEGYTETDAYREGILGLLKQQQTLLQTWREYHENQLSIGESKDDTNKQIPDPLKVLDDLRQVEQKIIDLENKKRSDRELMRRH